MRALFITVFLAASCASFAQENSWRSLVFEGAGIRGIAYAGVIKKLEEKKLMPQISRVGGTSAGAITALMVSLGYNSQEVYKLIGETEFGDFNDGRYFFIGGFRRLSKKYGWYRGEKFQHWLDEVILAKTGNPNITFAQLHDQKFRDLYVTGTSLNRQRLLIFSYETYPEMRVSDAVRISMSVPLYFEAKYIDAKGAIVPKPAGTDSLDLVVDGGITGNFPIWMFDQTDMGKPDNKTR
ncbi:MAG: patatin-like phospholipase family protein, partial [Mucilaginibacter polytrichastri]|nr:patatin-like phospholipase family protein [Mucilaginibacter polytrichastri]